MSSKLERYVDEYQNVHIKDKELGKGGQGIVFRTRDPNLAIKLVTDQTGSPVKHSDTVSNYKKLFKRVRILPIPENLNIAIPAVVLEDEAGYVMQLLSEMIPLSHFWLDVKSAKKIILDSPLPSWLFFQEEIEAINVIRDAINQLAEESKACQEQHKDKLNEHCSACQQREKNSRAKQSELLDNFFGSRTEIIHYYQTGGLRRRLLALYQSAVLLARLHANGMVYGDVSPNNIFISETIDNSSVWFIDADNLRFEVEKNGSIVFTPKYGAPELIRAEDIGRPSSDCHAFAVVAFYLLSLIHPLIGNKIDNDDDDDWASDENDDGDREERAYAGFYPWVDDEEDDSNASDAGLPRALLLTEELSRLFQLTFGLGRKSPHLRPCSYHWPSAFAQAADTTIICPTCTMSYYYHFVDPNTQKHQCPYCKTPRPRLLLLEAYAWDAKQDGLQKTSWVYVKEIFSAEEITIPKRVFDEFDMQNSERPCLHLSIEKNTILLRKSSYSDIEFSVAVQNHSKDNFQPLHAKLKIDSTHSNTPFWLFAHSKSPRLIHCKICEGN